MGTGLYLHMSRRMVNKGDAVRMGQRIGSCGSTGSSTSPHLHFGLWLGEKPRRPFKVYDSVIRGEEAEKRAWDEAIALAIEQGTLDELVAGESVPREVRKVVTAYKRGKGKRAVSRLSGHEDERLEDALASDYEARIDAQGEHEEGVEAMDDGEHLGGDGTFEAAVEFDDVPLPEEEDEADLDEVEFTEDELVDDSDESALADEVDEVDVDDLEADELDDRSDDDDSLDARGGTELDDDDAIDGAPVDEGVDEPADEVEADPIDEVSEEVSEEGADSEESSD